MSDRTTIPAQGADRTDRDAEASTTLVFPRAPASGRDYLDGLRDARLFFIDCRHDEKSGRKFLALLDQVIQEVERRG